MSPELEQLLAFAYSPSAFGKPMKRKVVQLGKKYYWDKILARLLANTNRI